MIIADLDPSQLLDAGPLGLLGLAVYLFSKLVASFTRASDAARECFEKVSAHLDAEDQRRRAEAAHRAAEREHWEVIEAAHEQNGEQGAQVIELLARIPNRAQA